jgi:MFS family permease
MPCVAARSWRRAWVTRWSGTTSPSTARSPLSSRQCFPGQDRLAGLVAVFAGYATAFLARPVGAIFFGRRGDRIGRRRVMVSVIVTMALATAAIGVLPSHAAVGILAASPAIYCAVIALLAVAAVLPVGETAFQPLRHS